jgi:hypothetical protein
MSMENEFGPRRDEVMGEWRRLHIDGRIILRRIFGKWDVGVWTGLGWLRIGTGGGRL